METLADELTEKLKQDRDDLVVLSDLEDKVARVLWPGIDILNRWTPEGRELIRRSISKLYKIFREEFRRETFENFCLALDIKPGDIVECSGCGTIQFVDVYGSYIPCAATRKVDETGYISSIIKTRPLTQFKNCKVVGHKDLEE